MKFKCTYAYTLRGEIVLKAKNEEQARQKAENLTLEEISNTTREANLEVATVMLVKDKIP